MPEGRVGSRAEVDDTERPGPVQCCHGDKSEDTCTSLLPPYGMIRVKGCVNSRDVQHVSVHRGFVLETYSQCIIAGNENISKHIPSVL